jgi:hypothetical protein
MYLLRYRYDIAKFLFSGLIITILAQWIVYSSIEPSKVHHHPNKNIILIEQVSVVDSIIADKTDNDHHNHSISKRDMVSLSENSLKLLQPQQLNDGGVKRVHKVNKVIQQTNVNDALQEQLQFQEIDDKMIYNHLKEFGNRKWSELTNKINDNRIKRMKIAGLEWLRVLKPVEIRARWFDVLLLQHPEMIPPPPSSVSQWGWGKFGETKTADDDDKEERHKDGGKRLSLEYYPRDVEHLIQLHQHQQTRQPSNNNNNSNQIVNFKNTLGGRDGQRVIFFMHVHKCGGSQICFLSKLHNFTGGMLPNCNLQGFGPLDYTNGLYGRGNEDDVTGELIYNYVTHQGWKLIMSEIALLHKLNRNKFLYAIQVRHPMNRILSHMRFEREDEVKVWSYINTSVTEFYPLSHNFGQGVAKGTAPYDNLLVRMMGGRTRFVKPPRSINHTDFTLASELLNQFELVIILENYEEDARIQLPRIFGWYTYYSEPAKFNARSDLPSMSDHLRSYLLSLNSYDLRLYDIAVERSRYLNEFAKSRLPIPIKKVYNMSDYVIR